MAQDVVIVTGASGFIGSALIARLAGRYALVGFDRAASGEPPPAAECVCIDLTSEAAIKSAFERVRIAYGRRIASVIHLAAYFDLTGEPSPLYESITVRGTERLLKHLQNFEVEQFVFASSILVHAPGEPGVRINEDSPLEPQGPYPLSKVETEALIHEKRGRIPAAFLRMAGVYDDRAAHHAERHHQDAEERDHPRHGAPAALVAHRPHQHFEHVGNGAEAGIGDRPGFRDIRGDDRLGAVAARLETGKEGRFLNTLCGLWLIAAPWLLEGGSMLANSVGALVGLALVVLSLPRGTTSTNHYGTWDRLIV